MNIKKKSSHQERSSRRSTASRAECFLVGVGDLADSELAWRLLQRLSGGVDGQVVRRPHCMECHVISNHPITLSHPVVTNRRVGLNRLLWRLQPSVSFWGLASSLKAQTVLVVPGRSSSVPGLSFGL